MNCVLKITIDCLTKLNNLHEIKVSSNEWTDLPCSWIGRISIVKMSVLPNRLIDSIQSQPKSQQAFLKIENGKFVIKFI